MMSETLEQYNRRWIDSTSSASSVDSLARMLDQARQSEHWNGKLAKHACHILLLLADPVDESYRNGKRTDP